MPGSLCLRLSNVLGHNRVAAYEAAKLASDFDPQNRDENVDYYIAKQDELVKKFGGVTAEAKKPQQESLAL